MKAKEFGAWPPYNDFKGGQRYSANGYNKSFKKERFPKAQEYANRDLDEYHRYEETKDLTKGQNEQQSNQSRKTENKDKQRLRMLQQVVGIVVGSTVVVTSYQAQVERREQEKATQPVAVVAELKDIITEEAETEELEITEEVVVENGEAASSGNNSKGKSGEKSSGNGGGSSSSSSSSKGGSASSNSRNSNPSNSGNSQNGNQNADASGGNQNTGNTEASGGSNTNPSNSENSQNGNQGADDLGGNQNTGNTEASDGSNTNPSNSENLQNGNQNADASGENQNTGNTEASDGSNTNPSNSENSQNGNQGADASDNRTTQSTTGSSSRRNSSTWEWNSDNTDVAYVVKTRSGSVISSTPATITSVEEPATCKVNGKITYTATVDINGKTYTDTRYENLPALGHQFDRGKEVILDGGHKAIRFECTRCHEYFEISTSLDEE